MVEIPSRFLVFIAILFTSLHCTVAIACQGCVDLDELSFDNTIARFPYAIVKFDVAYPYGEKHEAFADLSKAAHKVTDELLVATVGIKDYGDRENNVLSQRYNVDEKNYPGIFLFKDGNTQEYVNFPAHLEVTTANLQKFIMENTPLYIGLEGCLKEFNELAKGYANLDASQQLKTVAKAQQLAEKLTKETEKTSAKNYITFMKKINEKGYDFVEAETKRLQRLKGGKVSEAKKSELTYKLNVLESFRVSKLSKEEL